MIKAVFLDRDGVLNVDRGYEYQNLTFYDDVMEFVSLCKRNKLRLFVITNQSGIARSYFSWADVCEFHRRMNTQINSVTGYWLDSFYVCPHLPTGVDPLYGKVCECRKPGTLLVRQALAAWGLKSDECLLIGDRASDMECAERAKIASFMLDRTAKASKAPNTIHSLRDLDFTSAGDFFPRKSK